MLTLKNTRRVFDRSMLVRNQIRVKSCAPSGERFERMGKERWGSLGPLSPTKRWWFVELESLDIANKWTDFWGKIARHLKCMQFLYRWRLGVSSKNSSFRIGGMVELAGCAGCAGFDELLLIAARRGRQFYRLWKFATIISRCLNYNRRHSSSSTHLPAACLRCILVRRPVRNCDQPDFIHLWIFDVNKSYIC